MKKTKETDKKDKGITLIALAITIIVLIILAGISVATLTGNNGILLQTNKAKEETEIANEKEVIENAATQAMGNNKRGNLLEDEFQKQLDKITSSGKTKVSDAGDEFEVVFVDSNRYYTVDKDGNVGDASEIIQDKYPGDITVGKDGETLDGNSEETAYEIWCIEDLCAFSNMANNNNVNFNGKTIKVMRDLNFTSDLSYVNGNISVDGNIKSCESVDELKKVLTENEGFYPICYTRTTDFTVTFDGNNKKLKNIYINRTGNVGLFGKIKNRSSTVIKNLSISGSMIGESVGGIIGSVLNLPNGNDTNGLFVTVENCISDVNIKGTGSVGGIVGGLGAGSKGPLIVTNCINNGEINGVDNTGGIVGLNYGSTQIINTYNSGKVTGNNDTGGIIGHDTWDSKIINSYNLGDVNGASNAGGISGYSYWAEKHVENCYNIGKVSGDVKGGILGGMNISHDLLVIQNVFYLNNNISQAFGKWGASDEAQEDVKGVTDTEMKSAELLEKLNSYVTENDTKEDVKLKKWVKGTNGYPTFE